MVLHNRPPPWCLTDWLPSEELPPSRENPFVLALCFFSSLYVLVFTFWFSKVIILGKFYHISTATLSLLVFSWKTSQLTWSKLTLWCHSKRELYIVLSLDNWFHFPFFLLLQIILPRLVVSPWIGVRSKKQFTKLAISPCPLKPNPCL